eukprot:Hpha_TRINITY_DN15149_c3_g3::TRINITY_DN15149_c3_g3_i1::g.129960::m.129960
MDNQLQSVKGISPEEIYRFETLFKLFDEDGSGCISIVELADLMPRLGMFLSEEELQVLFTAVDTDDSGYIDFNEFLALMVNQREANQLALLESGERMTFSMLQEGSRLKSWKQWPDSTPVVIWEMVILVAAVFFYLIVLLEDAGATTVHWSFRIPPAIVLLLDVVLRSVAIARVKGTNNDIIVTTFPEVFFDYIKSPLAIVDLVAAVPLDFIGYAVGSADMALVLSHLRLVKLFRTPYLFPVLSHELMTPLYAQIHFNIIPMTRMLCSMVVVIHFFSCIWVSTGTDIGYLDACYFVLYTLTTVGYGDISVDSPGQKVFAIVLFMGSTVVTGLVVGKLVQWSQQADVRESTYRQMMETLAVLDHLTVPADFKQEILALQYHRMLTSFSMYESACAGMPLAMRDRMMLYARMSIVRHVPIFGEQPDICVAKLAMALVNVMVLPEEFIIIAGEKGSEMFFLFHGMCDVYLPSGARVAIIKRGGIFGEIALLEATRRSASIRSLTYCQLFRLDKDAFDDITLAFPALREKIEEEMNQRAAAGKKKKEAEEATKEKEIRKKISFVASKVGTDDDTNTNSYPRETTATSSVFGKDSNRVASYFGGSSHGDTDERGGSGRQLTIPMTKSLGTPGLGDRRRTLQEPAFDKNSDVDSELEEEGEMQRRGSSLSQSGAAMRVLMATPMKRAMSRSVSMLGSPHEPTSQPTSQRRVSRISDDNMNQHHSILLSNAMQRVGSRRQSVVASVQRWNSKRFEQGRGRRASCAANDRWEDYDFDREHSSHPDHTVLKALTAIVEQLTESHHQVGSRICKIESLCQNMLEDKQAVSPVQMGPVLVSTPQTKASPMRSASSVSANAGFGLPPNPSATTPKMTRAGSVRPTGGTAAALLQSVASNKRRSSAMRDMHH